ncbi:methyltransferase [Mangrovihabitans endophyticus]|uniref:O-methyltransferase n=1 Tax=Mangrovihabitans endophyticus TaxID=1751298 RepID=A0A8J3BWP1_9ACTN|nr:methyltransferase [Mangrovihabitans endophyticus]GGK78006.1 O-methyltransferase [Mangrovihabitans endophyticus]
MSHPFGSPSDPPDPARVFDLCCGFMISQTVFAAVEFGLFAAAGPKPASPAELAGRCGIPERSVRTMAELLAGAGLLVREDAGFRNAPEAEAFLSGRGPVDLRRSVRYWQLVSYPSWGRAVDGYRARRGVRGRLDEAQTEAYESSVALITAATAAELAHTYDFGRHRRLLDVGGGYGTFARPILAAYETLTATLVDLPEVTAVVAEQGVPRLTAVGADLFESPLPTGHDVILVANVVHLLPPDRIVELFDRLRGVAAPGTTLLLVDWWRPDGAPHRTARYGAGEFLMISGGDLYKPDEVDGWLAESGWRLTGVTALSPPAGVITAERDAVG